MTYNRANLYKKNAAFCDEELRFGIVMEEAVISKTSYRAKYY